MLLNPIFYSLQIFFGFPIAVLVAILDCLFSVGFSFIPSYIIKNIIFCMTEYRDFNEFIFHVKPYVLFYFIFFIISIIIFRLYDYVVQVKTFPEIKKNIIVDNFYYILHHSKSYFQKNFFGDITEKIDELQKNVVEMLKWLFGKIFVHLMSIIVTTSVLLYFNFKCGMLIVVWIAFFIVLAMYFGNKIVKIGSVWANKTTFLNGFMVDTLSNFMAVKIFNNMEHEKNLTKQYAESIKIDEAKIEFYFLICWSAYAVSFFFVQLGSMYILFSQYKSNLINASDFAFVWSINSSIVSILWKLLKDFVELPEFYSCIEQSLIVLRKKIDIRSLSSDKIDIRQNPSIEFKDVYFSFDKKEIFKNLNITIKPFEKIGIVGLSGSGKSTFINLLLRFYELDKGKILINNHDITSCSIESLYDNITIIPQDSLLFNRSILDNIVYGNHHASKEEIEEAIKLSSLDSFIEKLPHGVHSSVGNQGTALSGGQRQRIAIARAYLKKDASIIILDEATSNLDTITEMKIQKSLDDISKNKTTIVIAHRLATLEAMERILVFHEGAIVQDGSHNTLIQQDGMYRKLWHMQKNLIDETDTE
jgi:ATP-binding cassette subfamily B protein